MPTLSTEVEFEVFCSECGAGLCRNCTEGKTLNRGVPFISITPCEKCIKASYKEGEDKGSEEGYNKGYKDGHSQGYDKGYDDGQK